MLKAISLDVTGTLLAFRGHIGDIYCHAAKRAGLPCPDYTLMSKGFKVAYDSTSLDYPCFGRDEMTTKEWWRICVLRSFQASGYWYSDKQFDRVFSRIYASFGSKRAYSAFRDSKPFLEWSKQKGLIVGICSNETERYGDGILPLLGLDEDLDFMVFSKLVGKEKPAPEMFQAVLQKVKTEIPSEVLHVGDNYKKDYIPANNMGMHALLIDRFKDPKMEALKAEGVPVVENLEQVKEWIESNHLLDQQSIGS